MTRTTPTLDQYCFKSTVYNHQLQEYITAIGKYNSNIDKIITYNSKCPIFLDTNVLLRYYETPLNTRRKLKDFISKNKKRIYVTGCVQHEFVRNREAVIDSFHKESLQKLLTSYQDKVLGNFQSFRNDITCYLDDFGGIGTLLDEICDKLKAVKENLDKQVKNVKDQLKMLKTKDKYLKLLSEAQLIDNLSEEEVKMLKMHFDFFKKEYLADKKERMQEQFMEVFPGVFDIKSKELNPYGDFIIYHEMLKFVKENKIDVIFLTYDAKGDWLNANGEPHSHYIQSIYSGTGQFIYMLDAKRFFDTVFKTEFEQLAEELKEDDMSVEIGVIQNLIHKPYERLLKLSVKVSLLLDLRKDVGILNTLEALKGTTFVDPIILTVGKYVHENYLRFATGENSLSDIYRYSQLINLLHTRLAEIVFHTEEDLSTRVTNEDVIKELRHQRFIERNSRR